MKTYYGPGDEAKAAAARRDAEIDAAPLDDPEAVAALPWGGNYAVDSYLFHRVAQYARTLIERGNIAGAKRAMQLSSRYGMGIDNEPPPSDADFLEYMGESDGG